MTENLVSTDCGHGDISEDDVRTLEIAAATFAVCSDCSDDVENSVDSLTYCEDCDIRFLGWGDSISLPDGVTLPYLSRYSSSTIGADSWSYEIQNGETTEIDGREICEDCRGNYSYCEDCEEYRANLENYCDDCDRGYCDDYSCDESHAECGVRGNGSISESLSRPAEPGALISSMRGIGFEIERNTADYRSTGNVAREMNAQRILLESHGEHCGHEYVLLPMRGGNVESMIRSAFTILDSEGMTGTDDCGLHFHLDFTTDAPDAILRAITALRTIEDVLFSLTGDDAEIGIRRTSTWCRPFRTAASVSSSAVLDASERVQSMGRYFSPDSLTGQGSRYAGINAHAYSEHRTVEIRILDAALDAERVLVAAGIAAGIADFAIASTTGTLRALENAPLAMLYRAARDGFITPAAMRYAEKRFAAFLPTLAAERAAEIARQEILAAREAARTIRDAAQTAAGAAFDTATASAQSARESLRTAARAAVEAARAALYAAEDAEYRTRTAADAVYRAATVEPAAIRDAAYAAADAAFRAVTADLAARESALPSTRPYCGCGCGQ